VDGIFAVVVGPPQGLNKDKEFEMWMSQQMARLLICLVLGCLPALAQAWVDLSEARVREIAAWMGEGPQGQGPACADRSAWQTVVADPRLAGVLKDAQVRLVEPFPGWRDEDYLAYTRTGSRGEGERMMNARSAFLYPLVLAECVQWQGRYLARIEATLAELLRDPTWTWPAHDSKLGSYRGTHYEVDLKTADLAHDLAQTLWLLGDKLRPETRAAVLAALDERVFTPLRQTLADARDKRHWWLKADHNWNAVCLKGVIGAAITVLPDRQDRALFVAAGEHYIRNYVKGFAEDGYTGEGPGYWNYGFSHFVVLRELLMNATGNRLDLFADPKVRQMALYGARIEMAPGNVAAFADASPTTKMDDFSLAYANQALNLGLPATLGNTSISGRPPANSAPLALAGIILFAQPALSSEAGKAVVLDPLRGYFDQVGMLVVRPAPGSSSRLAASIKAGGNSNHSHNDIGSYVIALGAEQPTGDPGAPKYSAKTFSKDRYTIRAINSYGHPLPRIDGVLQREATQVKSALPSVSFTPEADVYLLDLRPAYAVSGMQMLTRRLRYERNAVGAVEVEDRFAFDQARDVEVPLIVSGNWRLREDGRIELWQKREHLLARIETSTPYTLNEERIDEEGKAFTRLAIHLAGKQEAGFIRVRFSPSE